MYCMHAAGVSAMEGRGKKKPIRKVLTLKQKVDVVDYVKKNPGTGSRKVADVFKCGKTQIQCVLRHKDEIMDEFAKNAPESRKRHRSKCNADVNEAVYK